MDLSLAAVILRLALGPMLFLHGWNKVFGSSGLAGTTRWFDALGLKPAWLHARIAPVNEMGAGMLLTLGLLTGPVCAAYVGLMVVAALTDHRGKGYFVFKGGAEYVVLVAMVAVGIAAFGPGTWSLDHALGWDLAGPWWALTAAVGGTVAALALLVASYRPKESETS